ncbi:hypothetical protein EDB83DRAFT_2346614, partial [Lactarius deliciosus]
MVLAELILFLWSLFMLYSFSPLLYWFLLYQWNMFMMDLETAIPNVEIGDCYENGNSASELGVAGVIEPLHNNSCWHSCHLTQQLF